ncbi:hypothetical protein BDV98DRAFT_569901 [Pterulicium gracile]|uniref:Secreted protein n=1 Tax=Pterulicium gracile TaxID=1884261 RepID=A0A5C3QFY2_9AGAR|nr:hypothetical protein BDV98DRAFT_569901 [Pterula gracilis]
MCVYCTVSILQLILMYNACSPTLAPHTMITMTAPLPTGPLLITVTPTHSGSPSACSTSYSYHGRHPRLWPSGSVQLPKSPDLSG